LADSWRFSDILICLKVMGRPRHTPSCERKIARKRLRRSARRKNRLAAIPPGEQHAADKFWQKAKKTQERCGSPLSTPSLAQQISGHVQITQQ